MGQVRKELLVLVLVGITNLRMTCYCASIVDVNYVEGSIHPSQILLRDEVDRERTKYVLECLKPLNLVSRVW